MANIVFYNIFDEKCDYDDSHYGIDKVEPVSRSGAEVFREMVSYCVYEEFEQLSGEATYYSDHEGEDNNETFFLNVPLPPLNDFSPPFGKSIMSLFISQFINSIKNYVNHDHLLPTTFKNCKDCIKHYLEVDENRHI